MDAAITYYVAVMHYVECRHHVITGGGGHLSMEVADSEHAAEIPVLRRSEDTVTEEAVAHEYGNI
jgi:hypothetical protein